MGICYLLDNVGKRVARGRLSPLPLLHPGSNGQKEKCDRLETTCLGGEADGAAAASAAAFAKPCSASMGAFNVERGRVSSDSSSDEGAVLGTIPYVAYLCGFASPVTKGRGKR